MRGIGFALIASFVTAVAQAAPPPQPPLEAYGALPTVRAMTLSPDGSRLAFIVRRGDADLVALYATETSEITGRTRVERIHARDISFAGNQHLLLQVSRSEQLAGARRRFEYSGAFALDLDKQETRQLLSRTEGLYPAQTGVGRVVGQRAGSVDLFMPAYSSVIDGRPPLDLYRVSMETGRGVRAARGTAFTLDWVVGTDGTVLAREDFDNQKNVYRISTWVDGERRNLLEQAAANRPLSLVGVKTDGSALLLIDAGDDDEGYSAIRELGFDGTLSAPLHGLQGADIGHIFMDRFRRVAGLAYSGPIPRYRFFDPEVDAAVQATVRALEGASVRLESWSDDWMHILYHVFDGASTGRYLLHDRRSGEYRIVAESYADIPSAAVGAVARIHYAARDGLSIEAMLTLPPGVQPDAARGLPLVVMPHGGPAAHDTVRFDWMAQFFASRGFLVLQPNFRGSSGYGAAFREAGYGEWGRKMQDDVSDGVLALVRDELADPQRVCIVGASYGGYSALAGAAFTPELYRCVVAVAPVSDLPRMIREVASRSGSRHWVVDYWKQLIGDPRFDRQRIDQVSPVNHAEAFRAPVLLIHGRNDSVVPIRQSEVMERALKRAGKNVQLVRLAGEDHWLSDSRTRTEALKAMGQFVERHIGGH